MELEILNLLENNYVFLIFLGSVAKTDMSRNHCEFFFKLLNINFLLWLNLNKYFMISRDSWIFEQVVAEDYGIASQENIPN